MNDEGELFVEGTGLDITDRKQMEKELRTIASIVEASSDFIGFAEMDGKVLFVNQAGRQFVGLEPDVPVRDRHILDYVAESSREFVVNTVLPIVMRDGRWAGEIQFRNFKTGAVIPMWQSAFCITDPATGRPIAHGTVCRDLTERKREENDMRAARRAAEAGNLAKSRFLANMSHEIRTPMNGVLGMARLLAASELPPELRRYVDVIVSSGCNLLALVNDILDLSKIEAGRVALERLDFELTPVVEGAVQPLAMDARSKGLVFTTAVGPGVPRILRGDPARLRQVIVNLAGNAVKFTSVGSVSVQVELLSRLERYITLRFHFTDTGIGIPEDQRENLFSPFAQGDESTTRKFGGSGLGLSISKQLVELMGGQIGFESQPGHGSYFWFTVVLEETAAATVVASPRPKEGLPVCRDTTSGQSASCNSGKILVVEDNAVNRDVLVALLQHLGYPSETAANGREAIQALQSKPYDLVLMDCQMPELDGYEATRLIRDPATGALNPRIAIVAVTASAMPGDREKCIAAGMDDYLSKPVEPQLLTSVLGRWLGRAVAHRDGAAPKQPAAPNETCVFDYPALLKRVMGNHVIAEKVTSAFLQAAPGYLKNLRNDLDRQDVVATRRDAHSLKGAAGTVSALTLHHLAFEMERAAMTSEWGRIAELLPEVDAQIELLSAAIEARQREVAAL